MPTIRLGDDDRERLHCQEWLAFDERVRTDEAEAFEEAGGTLKDFVDRTTVKWWRATVWLALYRSGVKARFEDVHFDLSAITLQDDPGKALSGEGGSRTRRTSASSTRRSTRSGSKS